MSSVPYKLLPLWKSMGQPLGCGLSFFHGKKYKFFHCLRLPFALPTMQRCRRGLLEEEMFTKLFSVVYVVPADHM